MSGDIRQFKKNKGYEAVPREMLQRKDMTPQAKGVLAELLSYDSNWVLYKTELYKRNELVGKAAMEKVWEELVRKSYMIQFRIRVGKRYEFKYIFAGTPFELNEIKSITAEMAEDGYEFYLKNSTIKVAKETLGIPENQELTNDELSVLIWGSENQKPKESQAGEGFVGLPIMGTPKSEPKRTITKRDEDDSNNIKHARDFVEELMEITEKVEEPEPYILTARLFRESDFDEKDILEILEQISKEPNLLHAHSIVEQVKWVSVKAQLDGIFDLPVYFMNGLRKKIGSKNINSNSDFAKEYSVILSKNEQSNEEPIPLHNWLE